MSAQHAQYLESKVLTSPPQRLHLMLLEGAIRFGHQAADAMARNDFPSAAPPLMRVVDIVGELLAGVRGTKTALNDRLAKFYWFLFQRVSEAKINSDARKLAEALSLLEYERETWQLFCDQAAQATAAPVPHFRKSQPHVATDGRLSLEA